MRRRSSVRWMIETDNSNNMETTENNVWNGAIMRVEGANMDSQMSSERNTKETKGDLRFKGMKPAGTTINLLLFEITMLAHILRKPSAVRCV